MEACYAALRKYFIYTDLLRYMYPENDSNAMQIES